MFVLVMSLHVNPVQALVSEDSSEAIGLLEKIGIISTDEEFKQDDFITRIDYLTMVLSALGFSENIQNSKSEQVFLDVPSDDRNAGIISTAYYLNIIKGQADGRFGPTNNITFNEAIAIAIRALGCEEMAERNGGFPVGYLVCARNIGLLKGISDTSDKTVTNAYSAKLVYNLLNAKRLTTNNGMDYFFDEDTSYLSQNYNITRKEGLVDANSYSNLYGGRPLKKGIISIDNELYDVADEYDGLFIGSKVVFYYEENVKTHDKRIVYMFEQNSSVELLDIEDVVSIKNGEIIYTNEKGENKIFDLSDRAIVLNNGVRTLVPEEGVELPKYGNVKIIENSNDSYYDVVLISSYKIGIVKFTNDSTIYFSNKTNYHVALDDFEKYTIKDKDGNLLELTDIKPEAVLNVYESSDKSLVQIFVCTDTAVIEVKEIYNESNVYNYKKVVAADGIEYRTIRDFSSLLSDNDLEVGIKYRVTFDIFGRIAAVYDVSDNEIYKYGYLYKWGTLGSKIDDTAVLRILDSEGNFVNITAEKYVKNEGNGLRMNSQELLAACTEKQVIRYSLTSNGTLKTIEFPKSDSKSEGFRIGGIAGSSNNGLSRYYTSTSLIGGVIAVNKQTKIFMVPKNNNNIDNEEYYYAADITGLVNERYYPNATAYLYGDDIYAKVVVLQSDITSIGRDSGRMLITSIFQRYDEEKQIRRTVIKGFESGKERTLLLKNEGDFSYTTSQGATIPIEVGDVIRYETNLMGEIIFAKLVFDASTSTLYGTSDGNDDNVTYGSDVTHAYGQISRKIGNYFCIIRNGYTEESPYLYPITNVTYIYEYDTSMQKAGKARVINANDIVTLEDDPSNTDKVVIITRTGTVPFITIYK